MTTRRKFGMGIAAMLAAQRAPAALVRSVIAGRQIAASGGNPLPYDAEVEWIELTNGSFCTTPVFNKSSLVGNFRMKFPSQLSSGLGKYSSGFGYFATNRIIFRYGSGYLGLSQEYTSEYFVEFSNGNVLANGVPSTFNPNSFDTGEHVRLGQLPDNKVVIGRCRVWNLYLSDGVNSCDFIPVRFTNELGQLEGAMFDRVSGQLFRNAGTGAFVIGPVTARGASGQNGGGISG